MMLTFPKLGSLTTKSVITSVTIDEVHAADTQLCMHSMFINRLEKHMIMNTMKLINPEFLPPWRSIPNIPERYN